MALIESSPSTNGVSQSGGGSPPTTSIVPTSSGSSFDVPAAITDPRNELMDVENGVWCCRLLSVSVLVCMVVAMLIRNEFEK